MNIRKKLSIVFYPNTNTKQLLDSILNFSENIDYELIISRSGKIDYNELIKEFNDSSNKHIDIIEINSDNESLIINELVNRVTNEYFILIDNNTIFTSEFIENGLQFLIEHQTVSVYYSNYISIADSKEEKTELNDFSKELLLFSNFIGPCFIVKKSSWNLLNGLKISFPNEKFNFWDFWIRAAFSEVEFFHDKNFGAYFYLNESVTQFVKELESESNFLEYIYLNYKKELSIVNEEVAKQLFIHLDNLKKQIGELKVDLNDLENQNQKAIASILQQQQELTTIESSKFRKLLKLISHIKNRFRSNLSSDSNSTFIQKILMIVGKSGRLLLRKLFARIFKQIYLLVEGENVHILEVKDEHNSGIFGDPYKLWRRMYVPDTSKLLSWKSEIDFLDFKPEFDVLIYLTKSNSTYIKQTLDSLIEQIYVKWNLIIVEDNSVTKYTKELIRKYSPENIKIISAIKRDNYADAMNLAIQNTTSEFCVVLNAGDMLSPDALFQSAKVIDRFEQVDVIYVDHDEINEEFEHINPYFKPDWCPDTFLSRNYIGDFAIIKRELISLVNGFKDDYKNSEVYDLILRISEKTKNIYHIPNILHHKRKIVVDNATSKDLSQSFFTSKNAISDALVRRNEPGNVELLDGLCGFSIRYNLKSQSELISIIIPTKDKTSILKVCIESIFEKSTYRNFEVILVDNNSSEKEFFDYVESCKINYGAQFIYARAEFEFNFSRLMNFGLTFANGNYLVLLNNDTEVITPDWLEAMLEQGQRESIGVVGVKLLYPNSTIQHCGVVMGLGGAVGHVLVGESRNSSKYYNVINTVNNYSVVTAACIMVKKSIYEEVGGFDELFSVEYNDVDFCLKVRDSGRNNIYLPHVELFHYESISRGHPHKDSKSFKRHLAELELLQTRWKDYVDYDPCYNPNLSLRKFDFSIKV